MNIEKLLEQLRDKRCADCPHRDTCRDYDTAECVIRLNAATTMEMLQEENERLRSEADGMRSNWYKSVEEIGKVRAELEQVKRENETLKQFLQNWHEVEADRHGRWIDLNAENSTGPLFKCSECSHLHNPNRDDLDLERVELKPLYCDACGAIMDGK